MQINTLTDYLKFTDTTAIYPKKYEKEYLILGLGSEIGELQGIVKKIIRDESDRTITEKLEDKKDIILKEIGDVVWYLVRLMRIKGIVAAVSNPLKNEGTLKSDPKMRINLLINYCVELSCSYKKMDYLIYCYLQLQHITQLFDTPWKQVIQMNVDKLSDRQKRNKLEGSGDYR